MRAFTNYLPGFNIPMLPRELSDDLCSCALTKCARCWPAG
nr:Exoribonuclease 2 [Klebsiella pneumoniae]